MNLVGTSIKSSVFCFLVMAIKKSYIKNTNATKKKLPTGFETLGDRIICRLSSALEFSVEDQASTSFYAAPILPTLMNIRKKRMKKIFSRMLMRALLSALVIVP